MLYQEHYWSLSTRHGSAMLLNAHHCSLSTRHDLQCYTPEHFWSLCTRQASALLHQENHWRNAPAMLQSGTIVKFEHKACFCHATLRCPESNQNVCDIAWNVVENMILQEFFRVVSCFPRYISSDIAENGYPWGQWRNITEVWAQGTLLQCYSRNNAELKLN